MKVETTGKDGLDGKKDDDSLDEREKVDRVGDGDEALVAAE